MGEGGIKGGRKSDQKIGKEEKKKMGKKTQWPVLGETDGQTERRSGKGETWKWIVERKGGLAHSRGPTLPWQP